jgi:acyl-CoA hydrolase/GNAT superfamily N-acetyltransferase
MNNDSISPSWDAQWQTKYADQIQSAQTAVAHVAAGQRVFIGTGCAQPRELVAALAARAKDLVDTEIVHLLTQGDAPYATRELARNFRINTFFISKNVRDIIQEGLGDYTPIFLSDIPRLFSSGQLPLDVALIQVTPPDEKGMCSLGVSVDIVKSAMENARLVVAEVNPRMPRTLGGSLVNVYDIDILVPVDTPITELEPPEPDETTRRIGEYVAALIDDHSTVEFGIGRIPQAVMPYLYHKKDIGIHTEMFSDSIIELIESGAVTGERKTLERGKISASFCMGTRKLYDYIDNNPVFSFHPTEYINDPMIIGQQHRQVAINVALEVDLTGQVCADSLGSQFYSGIGGQVDFNRGAARSPGGKAIIAMPSTAKGGSISRIACRLPPGAGVVTTRGDVHYVVTEYGVAYLHGKNVQERAIALISIAHPDFREALLKEAVEARYVRADLFDFKNSIVASPPQFRTTHVLDDGTQILFRPIHPTDESAVRDLHYTLSRETIYYRFMSHVKWLPRRELQNLVYIDHRKDIAIVGSVPEAHGEEIVAIGRYFLNEKTNLAEVAFVVHDRWQNRGIGSALLSHLATIARRNGIAGFTAEVLRDNRAMQQVFQKSSCRVKSTPSEDVVSFLIEFA